MKRIALILVAIAAAVMLTGGLATPVQASTERSCRIGQNRIVKTANMAALTRKAFDRAAKLAVAHDPTFKAFVFGSGQFLPLKVGERARVEAEAGPLLQADTYLEPFALRALGIVREDANLIERAAGRFDAFGLDWHAAHTRALL